MESSKVTTIGNGRFFGSVALICGIGFIVSALISIFGPFKGDMGQSQIWSAFSALCSIPVLVWFRLFYHHVNQGGENSRIEEMTNFTENYLKRVGDFKKEGAFDPTVASNSNSFAAPSQSKPVLPKVIPVESSLEFRKREASRV